ncbi:hypothetical protein LTR16_011312, partial [Cryomyces antarcticus]
MRSVVAGRVVNVYSTNDYILGFLYRSSSIQYGVAGLQAIEGVTGVQNVDVSDLVSGHTRYRYLTGSILKKIGFEDIELEEVHREEEALREADRREEEQRQESAKKDSAMNPDEEVKDMEKEVEERNQESMMGWATEKLRLGGNTAAG